MSIDSSKGRTAPDERHRHLRVIAIDGPAAAGKTTVAYLLANRLRALLFDTGALYRVIAYLALTSGVSPDDGPALSHLARSSRIELAPPSHQDGRLYDVHVNGRDITWKLRSPEVGAIVSRVARHPDVREALLPLQREIAAGGRVVMAGRDVGTVVVPAAGLKIFLDASPEERARRRYNELQERGVAISLEEVLEETRGRDVIDRTRKTAPLRAAPDALVIKTDHLTAEEVVSYIERAARAVIGPTGEHVWT